MGADATLPPGYVRAPDGSVVPAVAADPVPNAPDEAHTMDQQAYADMLRKAAEELRRKSQ